MRRERGCVNLSNLLPSLMLKQKVVSNNDISKKGRQAPGVKGGVLSDHPPQTNKVRCWPHLSQPEACLLAYKGFAVFVFEMLNSI